MYGACKAKEFRSLPQGPCILKFAINLEKGYGERCEEREQNVHGNNKPIEYQPNSRDTSKYHCSKTLSRKEANTIPHQNLIECKIIFSVSNKPLCTKTNKNLHSMQYPDITPF